MSSIRNVKIPCIFTTLMERVMEGHPLKGTCQQKRECCKQEKKRLPRSPAKAGSLAMTLKGLFESRGHWL
jgi:hypothetical protein